MGLIVRQWRRIYDERAFLRHRNLVMVNTKTMRIQTTRLIIIRHGHNPSQQYLLTDADYWSRFGVNIFYDPLFKSCLDFDRGLREKFPEPIKLPLFPENMPYYRGPHVIPPSDTAKPVNDVHHSQSLQPPSQRLTAMAFPKFGDIGTLAPSDGHASTNHKFPCYSQQVLRHSWAVYSFGGGHFASTISSRCLTFCVKLAWDQCEFGCALF